MVRFVWYVLSRELVNEFVWNMYGIDGVGNENDV